MSTSIIYLYIVVDRETCIVKKKPIKSSSILVLEVFNELFLITDLSQKLIDSSRTIEESFKAPIEIWR